MPLCPTPLRSTLARLAAIATLATGLLAPAAAADPSFTIRNKSGLGPDAAKFYYLGFGTLNNATFVVLGPQGQWINAGASGSGWKSNGWNPSTNAFSGAGIVPCYALSDGMKVTIPKNIGGARVYFFQVNKGTKLFGKPCNNAPSTSMKVQKGIFGNAIVPGIGGQAPFSYFSSAPGGQMTGASLAQLTTGALPMWTYSEVGSGTGPGTIDTSQVDFVGFPMNVTAKMITARGATTPVWNSGVGFSFSPSGEVNMQKVLASYRSFVNGLPEKSKAGTTTLDTRANYRKLITSTPGGTVLVNPGNYLGVISSAGFGKFFLNIANNYMWKPGWRGTLNLGSPYGTVQAKNFSGRTVSLTNYPGYSGTIYAIEFSAQMNGDTVMAYVLSPISYQKLCVAGAIAGCTDKTPAEQIFADDGALAQPTDNNQFMLLSQAQRNLWNAKYGGSGNYNAVVARFGLIISMAYNHGVAGGLQTRGGLCEGRVLSACWSDQRLWFPKPSGSNYAKLYFTGDTTQNEFARWIHTAMIGSFPMMTRPTNPVRTATGVMGMGYGFASDENPTPPNAAYTQTPSKYDSVVSMSPAPKCNYITIMPWNGGKPNTSPVTDPACK